MDVRLLIATWPPDSPRGAVSRFCEVNGISRSRFYEIRRRAELAGGDLSEVLADRSRRPVASPNATALELEDLAVRVRKQLADDGWDHGPRSVGSELIRLGVTPPSPATLARIFRRRGLVTPSPQKRPRASWKRFEFLAPNACWQIDATQWVLLDGTDVAIFQVLDDCSRRLLASVTAPTETSEAAIAVVSLAIERFGVPVLLLSDNGVAFNPERRGRTGQLATMLRNLGCRPITSTPGHPQTLGKNERVHLTLKRWLDARHRAANLVELQAQLDEFDEHYNTRRPHQALKDRTPIEVWNSTPHAPSPQPPTRAQGQQPPPAMEANERTVGNHGRVWFANRCIHIGFEHIGHKVLGLRSGDHLDIFTSSGTHIRSVDFEPGKTTYPSGRPRGGTLAMKRSAGTTSP